LSCRCGDDHRSDSSPRSQEQKAGETGDCRRRDGSGGIYGIVEKSDFVLFEAYGYSNQGYHVFFATSLQRGETAAEPEE
jgi:hypothetical protein